MKKLTLAILLMTPCLVCAELEAIRTLSPKDGQEERYPVEAQIFNASLEQLPALEQELLAIFKASDTTLEGKQYACRMLRFCASDAAVPVLAPKLTNPDLSAYVRLVLQRLATPAAEKALTDALSRTGNPALKVGIIGTLGQLPGSTESVMAIRDALKSGNSELQLAAITALGNIGGMEAAKVLVQAEVRPELVNAWIQAQLKCVGSLDAKTAESAFRKYMHASYDAEVRAAALVGLVSLSPEQSADTVLGQLSSGDVRMKRTAIGQLSRLPTDVLITAISQQDETVQIRMLQILADRKAAQAEAVILKLAAGENETVRDAANQALAAVGSRQSVEILIDRAPTDQSAFEALCSLEAGPTDTAIMKALQAAEDDRVKSRLLECLSRRRTAEALPLFIAEAEGDWSRSCSAAIAGMANLVSEKDFSVYAALLLKSDNNKKTAALEKSIAAAARRTRNADACARQLIQAAPDAKGDTKYAFVRALGGIGGREAKKVLVSAVQNSEPEMRDAAVRGLANWPTPDAAPILLEIAAESENETHRVLALRGYIRLANGLNDVNAVLEMCRRAAEVSERPAELKAIISCAKKFRQPQVLDFLMTLLDNTDIYTEAARAILEVAPHGKVRPHADPALEKIIATAKDPNLVDEANAILDKKGN